MWFKNMIPTPQLITCKESASMNLTIFLFPEGKEHLNSYNEKQKQQIS